MQMTIQMIILFLIANLINVMLSTIKSIITARSDSKIQVSSINAATYGFYAIIVKQLASLPLEFTIIVTIIANFVGVSGSMFILEKLKKDKLWKVSATVEEEQVEQIKEKLIQADLSFSLNKIYSKTKKYYSIDIFSHSQKESALLKPILNQFNVKYHYSEVKNRL